MNESEIRDSLVLVVDDNPNNIQVLGKILTIHGFKPAIATSGKQAIKITQKRKPDLILMDIMMPEMDGFETTKQIKSNPELIDIPVIFLTAKIELQSKLRGFELGAVDYITKPFESIEVMKRVETHLKLKKAIDIIKKYNNELEVLLEERTRDLIETERHAAFSLMIQGLIHNFKNVLTGIYSYGDYLQYKMTDLEEKLSNNDLDLDGISERITEMIPYCDKVVERSHDMNEMVSSLMVKSRQDKSTELQLVDLNDLLKRELDFYNANLKYKHNVTKEIYLSDESLYVQIVPGEMTQVFQNLISNALDAFGDTKKAILEFTSGRENGNVWVSIKDNGPGIPQEIQTKIFDPFFTTKKRADNQDEGPSGTGLGLYMCKQTVESYDGELKLESQVGQGTRFKIILPEGNKGNGLENIIC